MKYKTYVFDLDGTLIDTLQDLTNAVNVAMDKMGYPQRTVSEVRSFVGNGIPVLVKRSVPDGTGEEDCKKALAYFSEYYLEHLSDFTRPYDGVIELVDKISGQGGKTAVVTNKAHDAAQKVVRGFFGDRFDVIVGKMDEFPPKPAPESVYYAMKALKALPEDCVYIGDSDVDVATAHNAGLPCIGVTWGFRDRELLRECGAEYIVDTPSEIIDI